MAKRAFFIEITDTFGGEANYSWATRYKVIASTVRGAMVRLGRESGLSFRKVADFEDVVRYDSSSGATCAFVSDWSDDEHGDLRVNVI